MESYNKAGNDLYAVPVCFGVPEIQLFGPKSGPIAPINPLTDP